jgi:hypothetical protein
MLQRESRECKGMQVPSVQEPLNAASLSSCDETEGFKRSKHNGNWPVRRKNNLDLRTPKFSNQIYKTVIQNGTDFIQTIPGRNWMQTNQIHSHINSTN